MEYSLCVQVAISQALYLAEEKRHEFVTPEHLLRVLFNQEQFINALDRFIDHSRIIIDMESALDLALETLDGTQPGGEPYQPEVTLQLQTVLSRAAASVPEGETQIDVIHLVEQMVNLKESTAAYVLTSNLQENMPQFFDAVKENYLEFYTGTSKPQSPFLTEEMIKRYTNKDNGEEPVKVYDNDADDDDGFEDDDLFGSYGEEVRWQQFVTSIIDDLDNHNPLIGREQELQRTIEVLCRKDKNNPLHIGDPGVGKTTLIYGLAHMIVDGKVPERLRDSKIYSLSMTTLIAGTQYRGQFEERIKAVMDALVKQGNSIVYIDEIHQIMGAGQTGEGAMDASNILKPYLESGTLRFIGATTHDEYNRHIMRNKGVVRRFQTIDVNEPSRDDALEIIKQLAPRYEQFHGVKYNDEALALAVDASIRHIPNRYLPDKALDIVDEAGAWLEVHPEADGNTEVTPALVKRVVAHIAGIDESAVGANDNADARLESLTERILSQLYGQDAAVKQVVEAVQMSRAGLLDENKPLASLLFVGPTGVGKTELCRVFAAEMGVKLVRFDMSEYVEKHTVAKLIGSPAGYVGYDDGGLLTDAVRRNPDCVLLLDEIEKAHPDVFNILLQVMDYGVLTDNKGQKAYFRNVVLVMTSNAGAQFASQASVGFASTVTSGKAMLAAVKRTFKPEFINRLSGVVVFNDMDMTMAGMILDKKLRELDTKLVARNVRLTLTPAARQLLLQQGFTVKYGAREMDRVITASLKSQLMREMLFGSLKGGGAVIADVVDDEIKLKSDEEKN